MKQIAMSTSHHSKKHEPSLLAASYSFIMSISISAFKVPVQVSQFGKDLTLTRNLCREAVFAMTKSVWTLMEDVLKEVSDQSSLSGSKLPWPSENSHS